MQYLFMALFAAGIVGADQFTKYLTVANIPLHGHVDVFPGVVGNNSHMTFRLLKNVQ